MAAMVAVSLAHPDDGELVPRTDMRLGFWREYLRRISNERAVPEYDDDNIDNFIRQQEQALRSRFPISLEIYLTRHFTRRRASTDTDTTIDVTVILKTLSYGSLLFNLDIITAPFIALGLTPDDLLNLLERYTPTAIEESVRISVPPLDVKATGNVIQADDPAPTTISPISTNTTPIPEKSRLDKILNIANTSLVVVSAVFLFGAFLLFQSSTAERDKLTTAIIQERSEIAAQREKLLDRYADQLKGFRDYVADEAKHYGDWRDTEERFMIERLKQVKEQANK